MPVISLTTDFGLDDPYVGLVKGAILSINPRAHIVDLTHAVPPYDRDQAARTIAWAYPYFPPGTIHVVVVDPGVGSERGMIAFEYDGHLFLGPDNGVFTLVLADGCPRKLVAVTNRNYFRSPVSRTFHGRDIFGPVVAHLSRGVPLSALGPSADPGDLVRLSLPQARLLSPGHIAGHVSQVDSFGNLITDIHRDMLKNCGAWDCPDEIRVRCGKKHIQGLADHFNARPPGEALALIGSRDTLEICINQGHAARACGAAAGQSVDLTWPAE